MKKPITFGKYLLLERVNVGGMAEVFKAKAFGVEGFERLVAVKRILPSIAEDQEFITMFIDEAKISVQLTHANIAQIFDLGRVADSYFIAMEYVHGKDLRAIFDRARKRGETVPVPMACYLIMKVCEGLDYAHNKKDASGRDLGLVHRDVSPQNVLMSYDGEVKVIDFGIAKAAGKAGRTQAGILKGKFGYMSPEQVRGLPLDRRSDIFAVGIVLYELLTGERLFVGESDFSTLEKVRNVEIMPPSTYNRRIPDELEQIVLKALSKDVDDRYQTAMDLHDDLQSFMYTSGNFFSRKDLSAYQRKAFAEEIAKESAREEEYKRMEADGSLSAPGGGGKSSGLDAFDDLPGEPAQQAASMAGPTTAPPRPGAPSGPAKRTMLGVPSVGPAAVPPPPPRMSNPAPPPPPPRMSAEPPKPPPGRATAPTPAPPAPAPAAASGIDMDWDEEELSTQIYDKPEGGLIADMPGSVATAPAIVSPPVAAPSAPMRPSLGGGYGAPSTQPMAATVMPTPAPSPFAPKPAPSLPPPTIGAPSPFGAPTAFDQPMGREPTAVTRQPAAKSGGGGRGAIIALVVVILLAAVSGGAWMMLGSRPGTLHVSTTPVDSVVYVDDAPVTSSTTSPFLIHEVASGPHIVEVRRHGFETWGTRIELGSGEDMTLPAVTLVPVPTAVAGVPPPAGGVVPGGVGVVVPPPPGGGVLVAPPAAGTGFILTSTPSGATVFVNDSELPQRTPVTVTDLAPGTYNIRVESGASYAPSLMQITVIAGQMVTLPTATLAIRQVTVEFTSAPAGAEVTLTRGRETRDVGSTPCTADVDVTGGTWTVEMRRGGYLPYEGELVIPAGETRTTHVGELTERRGGGSGGRSSSGSSGSSGGLSPRLGSSGGGSSSGGSSSGGESSSGGSSSSSGGGATGGSGTLAVNTRPWSEIYVDGRLIGHTPQMSISLTAGSHTLLMVNEEFGIRETRRITITAGETLRQVITLTPGG